jgi:hypothetical protein
MSPPRFRCATSMCSAGFCLRKVLYINWRNRISCPMYLYLWHHSLILSLKSLMSSFMIILNQMTSTVLSPFIMVGIRIRGVLHMHRASCSAFSYNLQHRLFAFCTSGCIKRITCTFVHLYMIKTFLKRCQASCYSYVVFLGLHQHLCTYRIP